MAAKKITKVIKPKITKPVLEEPVDLEPVEEVVAKTMSEDELIGKFFSNAAQDKEVRLLISVGGPNGTVSIERMGMNPKLVFGKSLIDAIQQLQ